MQILELNKKQINNQIDNEIKTNQERYLLKNKLSISGDEFDFELYKDGLRLKDNKFDNFIPNGDIFSIRSIKLFKIEFYIYIGLSLLAFTFWWILGIIISIYTFAQWWASKKVVLLTNKGQVTLTFNDDNIKSNFLKELKNIHPNAFSIKKWFKFRKES